MGSVKFCRACSCCSRRSGSCGPRHFEIAFAVFVDLVPAGAIEKMLAEAYATPQATLATGD
jgi:hypothetical protein